MQIISESIFNLIVTLALLLIFASVFFFSEEFKFYDVWGLFAAALGARNIVAYHLKLPFLWWYGHRQDLKTKANFQKQVYYSNYVIFAIGAGYIYA